MSGDERLVLTVPEVAAMLGLSRNGAYEAVAAGQIPSIRIGRRVLVPRAALQRLLDRARVCETDAGWPRPRSLLRSALRVDRAGGGHAAVRHMTTARRRCRCVTVIVG